MVYYVIESQVNGETGSVIPTAYTDKALAEQAYHTSLAAAAVSSVQLVEYLRYWSSVAGNLGSSAA